MIDYIIRLLEQFTRALASIIRARQAGKQEEAYELVQNAGQLFLGIDINTLLNNSPDQLLDKFRKESNELDVEKCIFCAELLYEMSLISEAEQFEDVALHLKILSLNMFISVIPKEKQFQNSYYLEKVEALLEELQEHVLPDSVLAKLNSYQDFLGKKQQL